MIVDSKSLIFEDYRDESSDEGNQDRRGMEMIQMIAWRGGGNKDCAKLKLNSCSVCFKSPALFARSMWCAVVARETLPRQHRALCMEGVDLFPSLTKYDHAGKLCARNVETIGLS